MASPVVQELHRHGLVLDGGMSNALEQRGHVLTDRLWTAGVLRDDPGAIAAVHRAYYAAGARVATTASYQASVAELRASGLERAEAEAVIRRSVTLATDVRDSMADDGVGRWVAASVGPYGAGLADGSEYRGRYGLPRSRLRSFHESRLELLASAGPDLLAVETIPDLEEAEVLGDLLQGIEVPAWFSFSVDAGRIRAGQPLAEAFACAAAPDTVVAIGVNCCQPDEVLDAVSLAADVTGKPAVAYPNSGEVWDDASGRWRGSVRFDARLAIDWIRAGARLVGGCCRVGPTQIAGLAAAVAESAPRPGAHAVPLEH